MGLVVGFGVGYDDGLAVGSGVRFNVGLLEGVAVGLFENTFDGDKLGELLGKAT